MMRFMPLIKISDGAKLEIHDVLRLEIPENAFFKEKGIYNYHGGANVLFDNPEILQWIILHRKGG